MVGIAINILSFNSTAYVKLELTSDVLGSVQVSVRNRYVSVLATAFCSRKQLMEQIIRLRISY